ncbi:hypothetical protein D1872_317400 [compost metagenome]
MAVEQAEPAVQDELWYENRLCRDHVGGQDDQEEELPSTELDFGESISRHTGHDHRDRRREQRYLNGVPIVQSEGIIPGPYL